MTDILDTKQAAEYLGISVSKLNRLRETGRIGYYGKKFECKSFSRKRHLDVYLESVEVVPRAEKPKRHRRVRTGYKMQILV